MPVASRKGPPVEGGRLIDEDDGGGTTMKKQGWQRVLVLVCVLLVAPFSGQAAAEKGALSKGQLIYVPAYSHIYSGDRERPFLLTVTLSIRNIDPVHPLRIVTVDYYETQGRLVRTYLDKPVLLKPLESLRYVIAEKDKSGGSGANFMVRWQADALMNPPIVEAIMIGTQAQQGVSFLSRGREVLPSE
jgi:hypothetical protein